MHQCTTDHRHSMMTSVVHKFTSCKHHYQIGRHASRFLIDATRGEGVSNVSLCDDALLESLRKGDLPPHVHAPLFTLRSQYKLGLRYFRYSDFARFTARRDQKEPMYEVALFSLVCSHYDRPCSYYFPRSSKLAVARVERPDEVMFIEGSQTHLQGINFS